MNQLAHPIAQALHLPGAAFTRNALTIEADANPKQLKLIGDFLSCVSDSADWWKTDYVKAVSGANLLTAIKGDDPHAKARTICQEQGMEQGSFDFYLTVAALFPPSLRVEGLTFDHHKEALIGTDSNQSLAIEWLERAKAEGWDVPQLRKALRQANATYHTDNLKPTGNGYSAIIDAERWARTQEKQIASYTPERAKAILTDIRHLRELIEKLEAIAGAE